MSRAFDHHLHIPFPGPFGQLSQNDQFLYLGGVGGILEAPRTTGVAQADGDIIFTADFKQIVIILKEWIFFSVQLHPGKKQRPSPGDNIGQPGVFSEPGGGLPVNTGMDGHKIHPVPGVFFHHPKEFFHRYLLQFLIIIAHGIVNWHSSNGGRRYFNYFSPEFLGFAIAAQVHDGLGLQLHGHSYLFQLCFHVAAVLGNPQVDIDLGPQSLPYSTGVQGFVVPVGGNDHLAFGHKIAKQFLSKAFFTGHRLHFCSYDSFAGGFHLSAIIQWAIPPYG